MSSPNIVDLSTSPYSSTARKRLTTGTPVYSPNETLNQMTQEAEARQADKYTAQKEIRAIRAKEMEKQRKEDEEREREETNRINRAISSSNYQTKPRLYSTTTSNSRFDEPTPIEDNPKELKKKILEMDEKFKKHAMFQTQLENDNQKLIYEVDLLKDLIEEHQELIVELRRQFKEKSNELAFQKRGNKDLQTDFVRLKEILKQRDALIEESGLKLYTDYEIKKCGLKTSDQGVNEFKSVLPAVLLAPDTAKLLDMLGDGTIDDKLRRLFNEKQELKETNGRLTCEIEDERNKSAQLEKKLIASMNKLSDNQETSQELQEIQRQYTKEINDLKMKLQKVEHENIIIRQDKQRLDTQLKYLQTNFEQLESTERRLMKERREAQRELNEQKMLVNELQLKLEVLQKTLDKQRQKPPKYIDTSYQSLGSSSTSLITSNHILSSSSSSTTIFNNLEQTSQDSKQTDSDIKNDRSSTPSQPEFSSSPTSSSASSSSSASPQKQNDNPDLTPVKIDDEFITRDDSREFS